MSNIPQRITLEQYHAKKLSYIHCPDCHQQCTVDAIEMHVIATSTHFNVLTDVCVHCEDCGNYATIIEEWAVGEIGVSLIEDYSANALKTEDWLSDAINS